MPKNVHHPFSRLISLASPVLLYGLYGQQIDDNGNGLSDVWEAAHRSSLMPDIDQDGGGFTNLQEAACGTDPANSASYPFIRGVRPET